MDKELNKVFDGLKDGDIKEKTAKEKDEAEDIEEEQPDDVAYRPKAIDGPENIFQKADLIVTLEHTQKICFVMQQNTANIIRSLSVLNNTQNEMREVRIKVFSSPQFFEPLYFSLKTLAPGEENFFRDAKAVLDFDYLSSLYERVKADIVVEVEINEKLLKTDIYKIDVLAFDEWPGMGTLPELLASFCTPAAPAVSSIISEAAQLLKNEDLSFNGYQSSNPNVVNKQLAAIFSVIKARNIAYSMPPASFEQQGQKIRLPQVILDLGLGTCLDTTMLLCSCAEAVGINPLIFIYSGHAFPAFWLNDSTFPESINDDLSAVQKRLAAGLNAITVLESTLLTDKKSAYTDAQRKAKETVDNGQGFICYIDIARARKSGILPLPLRYEEDGKFRIDRELYEASTHEVNAMRVIDTDLASKELGGRLEKWKRDLLDITLRNPLINCKINKTGIPLLNFDIEAVEDAFAEGQQLKIMPQPKEFTKQISDITKLALENDKQLSKILSDDLSEGRLRSSLNEADLTKRLTTLYRTEKQAIEENGASTLYLALGFLKWQEKDKPSVNRFAPIILLPMELSRRSASAGYSIRITDSEHHINFSLVEMLRTNFKIDLSGLNDLPSGEKGIDMAKVMTHIRKAIIDQKGWDVVEASSLGLFNYSKFVLWNDLNMREAALKAHPLTSGLINGKNDARLFEENPNSDERLYLPMDSDSSQTKAAIDAASGKSFVLHGPPGTGKSQTITNIIANALANNKRVLFVAEKMAALSVVKRRLDRIGIGDFCLELHSNKSQKRNFYEQFDNLLELASNASDVNFAEAARKLAESSDELESFNSAMHKNRKFGVSVYTAVNTAVRLGNTDAEEIKNTDIDKEAYDSGLETLRQLTGIGEILGEPVNSAFYGCGARDYSFSLRDNVLKLSKTISESYASYSTAMAELYEKVKKPKKDINILNYKNSGGIYYCLGELLFYKDKNGFVKFMSGLFSKRYKKMKKSPFYKKLSAFVKNTPQDAEMLYKELKTFHDAETVLKKQLLYGDKFAASEDFGTDVFSAAETYINNIASLRDNCIYNGYRNTAASYPQLGEVVQLYHTGAITSQDVIPLFEKSFWHCWLMREVSQDSVLNSFSPGEYAGKRARFAAVTELISNLTKKEIYLKLAANLPNFKYASTSSSEPGILLKAVKSRGRGITIRQLLTRVPELMTKVKPCMLMSPLSAAQFLPSDYPQFDIVVFDEASQLLTSEAVGAISRGKSTIVVGDPNQLPPTTFFATKGDDTDETEFETTDLESLLDDMLTLNVHEGRLLWHYRSEHESLIAFSNANYYDNKLITFPSPDDVRSRVQFKKVDGVYERGSTRTNPKEAEAVVEELFDCLKDPEKSRLSYGIVTFNITQQTLIEDLIDKRLSKEPSLERFFVEGDAPVFVKNIESVQGDERDVIFFSITYGQDKEGKMTVNFGPVNKDGGWRRLNVAITRACKRIVVFSTISPDMIDLSRTSSKGVKGLKDFMSFALNSRLYFKAAGAGSNETALVADIAKALRGAGCTVVENMGRSANKIDLAVSDDSGKYILGILCDNETAALHSDVRDREYGRENILKRMGWKLTRVYAAEWWQNPAEELKRLLSVLEGKDELSKTIEKEEIKSELLNMHREVTFDPSIPLPSSEYKAAELPSNTPENFYIFNYAKDIMEQIRSVIKTEGPLTQQKLYKTIASAWGITKMTQKYNEYIEQLIKRINPVTNLTQSTVFYWNQKEDMSMSVFRNPSERKADEIAKEEYAVAAYYIVQNAISIAHEDLVRETAKLFGFIKTPTASIRIGYALTLLITQGKIFKDGDIYKLK